MAELKQSEFDCQNEIGNADGAIRDLLRENERMRAALAQIAVVCNDNSDDSCNHSMALDFVRQITDRAWIPSATANEEQEIAP